MKTIIIEADDILVKDIMNSLKSFPKKKINYYIDESDDKFTTNNSINYKNAIKDLKEGKTISLEQLESGSYNV